MPTADVEFVQFHPTALHHPAMPRPLLSEALRGHGALLRDRDGERFVDELAPRDVVSRAMAARMSAQGVEHLWLDATGLERFSQRFPTIAASLSSIGLDPEHDWLPIAPAAHHLSGGVVTDLWGATALPGLWAVGEVACTGVHGANRLASNSLLEGMVFGARLAERIADGRGRARAERRAARRRSARCRSTASGARSCPSPPPRRARAQTGWRAVDVTKLRDTLQRAMTRGAGVVRSAESLRAARDVVDETASALGAAARRRPAPASWRTCSAWPTRCSMPRWRAPRAVAPTRGASTPTPTRPGAAASSTGTWEPGAGCDGGGVRRGRRVLRPGGRRRRGAGAGRGPRPRRRPDGGPRAP